MSRMKAAEIYSTFLPNISYALNLGSPQVERSFKEFAWIAALKRGRLTKVGSRRLIGKLK